MTDKLELKSCHEVIDTVSVADVDSIFQGKPTDPDILTVVMKDGKRLYCDEVCSADSLQEEPKSVWHDSSEMPKEKKVCLIRYSANDGASTYNFEVVITEPLTRRFVTRSYPNKTGYQHIIHSENTIKVDEYQDRREYIPFSDIDEWAYIDDLLNLSNVQRTVKNWKEPVSEDLEEASKEWLKPQLDKSYADYGEVKMMELTHFDGYAMLDAIEFGAKWQKAKDQSTIELAEDHAMLAGMEKMKEQMMKNIWKPADGDELPKIDREVIAILDNGKVVFAHRPPEYWDGKDIVTGKVTRNYPKTYDKGGWNIPNVKWWLDCSLPNMEED